MYMVTNKMLKNAKTLSSIWNFFKKNIFWLRLFCFILFIILTAFAASIHKTWTDEANAWMIAAAKPSFWSFFQMGLDGHPPLWHFILAPFAKLNFPFFTANIINLIFLYGAVFLLIFKSKLPNILKLLLPFTYFFAYEYALSARNYSLLIFILFLIALYYNERFKRPILFCCLIGLLALTHVQGLMMACSIILITIVEYISQRKNLNDNEKKFIIGGFVCCILLIILSVYSLIPPKNITPELGGWKVKSSYSLTQSLTGGFLTFLPATINFRDQNRIDNLLLRDGQLCLNLYLAIGMILFSLLIYLSGSNLKIRMLFFVFLLTSISIISLKPYIWHSRHYGLIFIFFIFCLWIDEKDICKRKFTEKTLLAIFLTLSLSFSIYSTAHALSVEFKVPVSGAMATAEYINNNNLIDSETLFTGIGHAYFIGIFPYLPKEKRTFYSWENEEYITHMYFTVDWLKIHATDIDQKMAKIEEARIREGKSKILFLTHTKEPRLIDQYGYQLLYESPDTIEPTEKMFIYFKKY